MKVRNTDLHKERKSIREGISEGKIKSFISLFLITDNCSNSNSNNILDDNESSVIRDGREEMVILYYSCL